MELKRLETREKKESKREKLLKEFVLEQINGELKDLFINSVNDDKKAS